MRVDRKVKKGNLEIFSKTKTHSTPSSSSPPIRVLRRIFPESHAERKRDGRRHSSGVEQRARHTLSARIEQKNVKGLDY